MNVNDKYDGILKFFEMDCTRANKTPEIRGKFVLRASSRRNVFRHAVLWGRVLLFLTRKTQITNQGEIIRDCLGSVLMNSEYVKGFPKS